MASIVEKVLAKKAGRDSVQPGDFVNARLDGVMGYQSFVSAVEHGLAQGIEGGVPRVWDPEKFYLIVEHNQPASSKLQADRELKLRNIAKALRVKHFYDVTCGVCHQIMVDKGHVVPGELILGSDSHTVLYGALNAVSTGIGETELAYAVTFGEMWLRVPDTIRVNLKGRAPQWPVAKDVILWLAGRFGADFAQYKAIEYGGDGLFALSVDERMCLTDHAVELGAKFGVCEADQEVFEYVKSRTDRDFQPVVPDPDTVYSEQVEVDLDAIGPQIAAPHSFDNVFPVEDMRGIRIDQAVIGSCANGRFEDLKAAAEVLKGRRVHPGVRLLVSPASWDVYKQCLQAGLPEIFIDAGAQFLDPGCQICVGYRGYLADGEVCISSSTRNYAGRMGSPKASVYLGNPATVAFSAVKGCIADPREVLV
ncbi:3-isopropylmalate dehydratase large subunit [Alicyclobacillus tolerans]|uniref:aconitase/3-isopropylmalate dehydratase large subunit family protein n=1 Tax=Alicyclobacillus tolerans TaxID=90970 RepID=UPI001EED43AD|nr:aconitase/3-isopropylmalate dehydratase large subunit family protein [Alicyclobacillus tolerans]MCF8565517.1 3-isopropylmalate dehydratase large subunit [Alicyclobacillus tolerans]